MTAAAYDDLVLRLRAAGCVFAEDEARVLLDAATGDALETAGRAAGGRRAVGVRRRLGRLRRDPGRARSWCVHPAAADVLPRRPRGRGRAAPRRVVVDLCCGSGALGLALAHRHPDVELHAADLDPIAVACARRNLEPIGATVHHGDLDAPLPDRLRGRVDVLVANVPYVPSSAIALMPPESRDHEPRDTVDGGADGLDVVRRLAALAPRWLAPGGRVFVETGTDQAAPAADAFADAGLHSDVHQDEERGATVVAAHDARITGAG